MTPFKVTQNNFIFIALKNEKLTHGVAYLPHAFDEALETK
jgi:hypothetical protein